MFTNMVAQETHIVIIKRNKYFRTKLALSKLSQNSTQPDMHIDISLAIYIHHSVTCQYIKLY